VVELNKNKRGRFATTAHVVQLKSWKLYDEEGEESDANEEDDESAVNQDEEGEVEPREVLGKPVMERRPPVWARDYV